MHYSVATFNVKYFLESRCWVCNVEVKYSTKWDIPVKVYGVENTKFSKVLFLESVCFCLKIDTLRWTFSSVTHANSQLSSKSEPL